MLWDSYWLLPFDGHCHIWQVEFTSRRFAMQGIKKKESALEGPPRLTLLLRIREAPGSTLEVKTGYADYRRGFHRSLRVNTGFVP